MDIVNLLISLASGVLGGNLSGYSQKPANSLGTIGNSLAGLLGGGAGNFLLQALGLFGVGGADHSIGAILSNIGASGLSGAVLPLIISFIRQALNK